MPGAVRRIHAARYSAVVTTVIDTDPGIDDALALLFAWASPDLTVDVVTIVAGNVPVTTGTMNVLRLLDLARPPRRPLVASGAAEPLRRPLRTATGYHGDDGLGDVPGWPPVDGESVPANARDELVSAARRHAERLTLVALGPLTNVALAFDADLDAMRRIGRIVAMGGAVDVPGNVTPTAEFNLWGDPDAARVVFEAGVTIDLVPLDATRQVALPRPDLEQALTGLPHAVVARVLAFTERGFRVDASRGRPGMILHDPLAVGVAIDPTFVGWERARLTVGADGETRRAPGAPNCRFARDVDAPRFLAAFLGGVRAALAKGSG
jgi:inosine-uridine nucleoside N-ribohydrolase